MKKKSPARNDWWKNSPRQSIGSRVKSRLQLTMKRTTVLLADDHVIVREGVRKLLESEGDIKVIGEARTGRQAVQLARKLRPAVIVMDIAMPLLNGLEATRQILRLLPTTRILILSAHSDDAYIEQATEAGVAGFLLKQTSSHVLSRAIREVQKGNAFFCPTIAKHLHGHFEKSSGRGGLRMKKGVRLSPREVEVLQLIAEGKANKATAAELGLSTKTIEKHREHLMRKLDIHDTAGLTRYAIEAGIIESSVQLTVI
jgi:DNA-binding NarL/FixJ family response regulator